MCDSLYDDTTWLSQVQLAQCCGTFIDDVGCLQIDIPLMQIQTGSTDWELFAIIFAYAMASGNQLVHGVHFDQKKMRNHLLSCIENRELTHFPCASCPVAQQRHHNSALVRTLCHCKLPEEYDDMIVCDLCEKWHNQKYIDYNSTKSEWLCLSCTPTPAKKSKLVSM